MKIGLTTSPRKTPTLDITYNSLLNVGVKQEEISIYDDKDDLGAWPNWFRGLKNLVAANPNEPWYGMFQDDILFAPNTRINTVEFPADAAICSLFYPEYYAKIAKRGWTKVEDPSLWAAQALILSNDAANSILKSQIVWSLRGTKQVDNRLGLWANKTGGKVYYYYPSLCEHIGETSTLWEGGLGKAKRAAKMQPSCV